MLLWAVAAILAATRAVYGLHNVTIDAQNTGAIAYSGNWTNNNDYCVSTRFASNQGDTLTFTFTGVAIYVVGTIDCGWYGLIDIAFDGQSITFDRRDCGALLTGQTFNCDYTWFSKTGLDPSTSHTLEITLTGPPPSTVNTPIIADLRYLEYTALDPSDTSTSSSAAPSSTTSSASTSTSAAAADVTAASSHKGLSGGAIGGIAAGAVAALLIFLFFCVFLYLHKRDKRPRESATIDGHSDYHSSAWAPAAAPAVVPPSHQRSWPSAQPPAEQAWDPSMLLAPDPYPLHPASSSASNSQPSWLSEKGTTSAASPPQPQSGKLQPPRPMSSGSGTTNTMTATGTIPDDDMVQRIATTVAEILRRDTQDAGPLAPPPQYDDRRRK